MVRSCSENRGAGHRPSEGASRLVRSLRGLATLTGPA